MLCNERHQSDGASQSAYEVAGLKPQRQTEVIVSGRGGASTSRRRFMTALVWQCCMRCGVDTVPGSLSASSA